MSLRTIGLAALASFALCALPGVSAAQWMWKDSSGGTVVSDQPPPSDVPNSRIIKRPGHASMPAPSSGDTNAADAPKQKSIADQDLEFKKRQKEAAEKAKKDSDLAAQEQAKQEHCASVRANMQALSSGQRIARMDENGQRYFLDDNQRQAEMQRDQSELSGC